MIVAEQVTQRPKGFTGKQNVGSNWFGQHHTRMIDAVADQTIIRLTSPTGVQSAPIMFQMDRNSHLRRPCEVFQVTLFVPLVDRRSQVEGHPQGLRQKSAPLLIRRAR